MRLIFQNGWFPWALVALFGVAGTIPLLRFSLFPATPSHIVPSSKISAMNWLEARSLAKKAQAIASGEAQGDLLHTWRMVINAHPTNVRYRREFLSALLETDLPRSAWQDAVDSAQWTLKLSQTNVTDMELVCDVYQFYRRDAQKVALLEAHTGDKSPALEKHYLESLLSTGQLNRFGLVLEAGCKGQENHQLLGLYQAALVASKSSPQSTGSSCQLLEDAENEESTAEVSARLQLFVADQRDDLELFESAFSRIKSRFRDRTPDHTRYWCLLHRTGKTEEAKNLANAYAVPPQTPDEVIAIATALEEIGLVETAYQTLLNYEKAFRSREQNWQAQAGLLIRSKKWKHLLQLASSIRRDDQITSSYLGYSYYLEGWALQELDRIEASREAFSELGRFSLLASGLGYEVASKLWDLGYPELAFNTLYPERTRYRNHAPYWELSFQINMALRNTAQMLVAAENLVRLEESDPNHLLRYTSLLVGQRHRKQEALKQTQNALDHFPHADGLKLNHAWALVLNDDLSTAENLLSKVSGNQLTASDKNRFYLASMELCFRRQEYGQSWRLAAKVIEEKLMPEDRAHYQAMVEILATKLSHIPGQLTTKLTQLPSLR